MESLPPPAQCLLGDLYQFGSIERVIFLYFFDQVRFLSQNEYVGGDGKLTNRGYKQLCSNAEPKTVDSFTTSTETMLLRNGTKESTMLVISIMATIEDILVSSVPMAFWDLARLCRDPHYKMFSVTCAKLVEFGLIEKTPDDCNVDQSIRNIVLSATKCDGADIVLVDPRV